VAAVYQWTGLALVVLLAGGVWYAAAGDDGEAAADHAPTGDTAAPTAAVDGDTAGRPRIAVLPFEHNARDTANAFFTRAMYDVVRTQLSGVSSLRVLSRRTGQHIAEEGMTAAEIGRTHDVSAILTAQVYRAGDELRITTQLVDAARDVDLWNQTYDRELSTDQIFDVQEDIAEQITAALETELTPTEAARIREAPTASMDALDALLKGRNALDAYSSSRDPRDIDRGIRHLREALRRDSTLAEGHAKLAEGFIRRYGTSGETRWLDSASAAVDRARRLGPDLSTTLIARANLLMERGKLGEAERLLRRVLDREPSNAEAIEQLGLVAFRSGQPAELLRWVHRTVRLAPRDWSSMQVMGYGLELVGFTEPARTWYRRSLRTAPDQVGAYGPRAMLRSRSDPDEALEIIQTFLDRHPNDRAGLGIAAGIFLRAHRPELAKTYLERETEARRRRARGGSPSVPDRIGAGPGDSMRLGMAEILLGNETRGRELLRESLQSIRAEFTRAEIADRWGWTVVVAGLHAALGEDGSAFRTLELGLERTDPIVRDVPFFAFSLSSPYFDSVRSDPRFREIEREVERRKGAIREDVRELGIALYPPGAGPDTLSSPGAVR